MSHICRHVFKNYYNFFLFYFYSLIGWIAFDSLFQIYRSKLHCRIAHGTLIWELIKMFPIRIEHFGFVTVIKRRCAFIVMELVQKNYQQYPKIVCKQRSAHITFRPFRTVHNNNIRIYNFSSVIHLAFKINYTIKTERFIFVIRVCFSNTKLWQMSCFCTWLCLAFHESMNSWSK